MACERTHVDDTSYRRLVVKEKEAVSDLLWEFCFIWLQIWWSVNSQYDTCLVAWLPQQHVHGRFSSTWCAICWDRVWIVAQFGAISVWWKAEAYGLQWFRLGWPSCVQKVCIEWMFDDGWHFALLVIKDAGLDSLEQCRGWGVCSSEHLLWCNLHGRCLEFVFEQNLSIQLLIDNSAAR